MGIRIKLYIPSFHIHQYIKTLKWNYKTRTKQINKVKDLESYYLCSSPWMLRLLSFFCNEELLRISDELFLYKRWTRQIGTTWKEWKVCLCQMESCDTVEWACYRQWDLPEEHRWLHDQSSQQSRTSHWLNSRMWKSIHWQYCQSHFPNCNNNSYDWVWTKKESLLVIYIYKINQSTVFISKFSETRIRWC